MKYTMITAAIIAASSMSTLVQADASNTVYGDFRASLASIDTGAVDGLSMNNNASRVGIKGSTSMDGVTAFYHLQMGASNDGMGGGTALTSRFYFAGLKGDFGKVVYGRTSTPYKMAGVRLDPFYDTSAGAGNGGANYGLSGLTNGFTNNSLAYSTSINDSVSVNVAAYVDDSAADEHDTVIGGTYKTKMITAGIQLLSSGATGVIAGSGADVDATRLHGTYKADANTVSLSYETVDTGAADDGAFIYLTGSHQMNAKTKVSASFSSVEDAGATDGDGVSVGVFHNILPKTTVYALYSTVDFDSGAERNVIGFGASHKFGMKH